jgi:hypothetical protein
MVSCGFRLSPSTPPATLNKSHSGGAARAFGRFADPAEPRNGPEFSGPPRLGGSPRAQRLTLPSATVVRVEECAPVVRIRFTSTASALSAAQDLSAAVAGGRRRPACSTRTERRRQAGLQRESE